jgi:hypothetical protein
MKTFFGVLDSLLAFGFLVGCALGFIALFPLGYYVLRVLTSPRSASGERTKADLMFRARARRSIGFFLIMVVLVLGAVVLIKYRIRDENPSNGEFWPRVVGRKVEARSSVVSCTTKSALDTEGADLFIFDLREDLSASLLAEYPHKAGYQEKHTMITWHRTETNRGDHEVFLKSMDFAISWLSQVCSWYDVERLRHLKEKLEKPGLYLAYGYYAPIDGRASVFTVYAFDPGMRSFYVVEYGI